MSRRLKAITMVETIIYLAIFGVVFGTILQFIITVNEQNYRAEFRTNLGKNVLFVTEHLDDSVDQTSTINVANSVFNNNSGVLEMNYSGGTLRYSLSGNRIVFQRNAESYYLTPPALAVNQLYFEQVQDDQLNLIGVRLTMHIYSRDELNTQDTLITSFFL